MSAPGGPSLVQPGAAAPPPLRSLGIVTAYNPASHHAAPAWNAAADARLHAALVDAGVAFHRALARGDAGEWDEPGWAVHAPRGVVVRLGVDFGQNAVVWITEDGEVRLVCTRPGFCGAAPGDDLGP